MNSRLEAKFKKLKQQRDNRQNSIRQRDNRLKNNQQKANLQNVNPQKANQQNVNRQKDNLQNVNQQKANLQNVNQQKDHQKQANQQKDHQNLMIQMEIVEVLQKLKDYLSVMNEVDLDEIAKSTIKNTENLSSNQRSNQTVKIKVPKHLRFNQRSSIKRKAVVCLPRPTTKPKTSAQKILEMCSHLRKEARDQNQLTQDMNKLVSSINIDTLDKLKISKKLLAKIVHFRREQEFNSRAVRRTFDMFFELNHSKNDHFIGEYIKSAGDDDKAVDSRPVDSQRLKRRRSESYDKGKDYEKDEEDHSEEHEKDYDDKKKDKDKDDKDQTDKEETVDDEEVNEEIDEENDEETISTEEDPNFVESARRGSLDEPSSPELNPDLIQALIRVRQDPNFLPTLISENQYLHQELQRAVTLAENLADLVFSLGDQVDELEGQVDEIANQPEQCEQVPDEEDESTDDFMFSIDGQDPCDFIDFINDSSESDDGSGD